MARFRYTGNSSLPQVILGLTFSADDWTDVPAELTERLSRHSHLECEAKHSAGAETQPEIASEPKRRGRPPKVREG